MPLPAERIPIWCILGESAALYGFAQNVRLSYAPTRGRSKPLPYDKIATVSKTRRKNGDAEVSVSV